MSTRRAARTLAAVVLMAVSAAATVGGPSLGASARSRDLAAGASTAVPQYAGLVAAAGLADLTPVDVAATATRYYVLDVARYRIVAIDRTTKAIVAEVGGSRGGGDSSIGAARSIAVDAAGRVYVADTPNARVQQYDAALRPIRSWGEKGTGPGQFDQVYGVEVGKGLNAGKLTEIVYAVDGAGRVQTFTTSGVLIGQFAPKVALNQPRMATVNRANNDLWLVNARSSEVIVFRADGTVRFRFGRKGNGEGEFVGDPRGIAVTPDGSRAFVSDDGNHRVQVFSATGEYVSEIKYGSAAPGYLVDPRGLDVTPDGRLVVADEWAFALKEFSAEATSLGAFKASFFGAGPKVGGVNSPRGLAVDSTNRVFVSDWWNQRIQRFTPGKQTLAWGARGTTREPMSINFAWDLTLQRSTGRIFLANRESHEIKVFTADGAFVTRWGSRGATQGKFEFPQGVAFDPVDGTLLVTDSGNGRVQRFLIGADGRGTYVTSYGTVGTAPGQFQVPAGIAVAQDGTVWVADTRNNRVQKRNPRTGAWSAFTAARGLAGLGFLLPWGVSVAPDGAVWVVDSGRGRVVKADADMVGVFAATGEQMGAGALNYPYKLEVGPDGLVYLSDTFNNRVIKLRQ